jgi:hypothetical protein
MRAALKALFEVMVVYSVDVSELVMMFRDTTYSLDVSCSRAHCSCQRDGDGGDPRRWSSD